MGHTACVASNMTCSSLDIPGFKEKCLILSTLDIPLVLDIENILIQFTQLSQEALEDAIVDESINFEKELIRDFKETKSRGLNLYIRSLDISPSISKNSKLESLTWGFVTIRCRFDSEFLVGLDQHVYFNISKTLDRMIH